MATALSLAGYFLAQGVRPRQAPNTAAAALATPRPCPLPPLPVLADGGGGSEEKTEEDDGEAKEELRLVKHLEVFPKSAAYGLIGAPPYSPAVTNTPASDEEHHQQVHGAIVPNELGRSENALIARSDMMAVAKHVAQLEATVSLLQDKQRDFEAQLNDLHQNQCRPGSRETGLDNKGGEKQNPETEKELKELRAAFESLQGKQSEMEAVLEGLRVAKEQEKKVRELESLMKVHILDARFLCMKVESLEEENERLQVLVDEGRSAAVELERSRVKVKAMKWRLKLQKERAVEEAAMLRRRVEALEGEAGCCNESRRDNGEELREARVRLQEAEEVVVRLREEIASLTRENAELTSRIESMKGKSLEPEGTNQVKEELTRLRQYAEELSSQVERLEADRCADAEQLVYLRWLNACLRYELRNHEVAPARDMNRSLSPQSGDKVRQLVLKYGAEKPSVEVVDLPFCSSWHRSTRGDLVSGGSQVLRSGKRGRSKRFLGMLKKFMPKKEQRKKASSPDEPSFDDLVIMGVGGGSSSEQSSRTSCVTDSLRIAEAEITWLDTELDVKTAAWCSSDMQATSSHRAAVEAAGEELRRYAAALDDKRNGWGASRADSALLV